VVAPCDKYQGLVAGPDGQTVTDPYGLVPTLGDYEEWRGVADQLLTRAEAELQREFETGGALMPEDVAPVEALRDRWNETYNAVAQAFADFPQISWGPNIDAMVQIASEAACQIGIIEARIVEAGGAPNELPERPAPGPIKGGGKSGKGMGGLLLILAVAYFAGGRR
jgi:hypothetical protein